MLFALVIVYRMVPNREYLREHFLMAVLPLLGRARNVGAAIFAQRQATGQS